MPTLQERWVAFDTGEGKNKSSQFMMGADLSDITVPAMELILGSVSRQDHRGRIVLNRKGALIAACDLGHHILKTGSCLVLSNGIVTPKSQKSFVTWNLLLAAQGGDLHSIAIPCHLSDGHLLLRAGALDANHVLMTLTPANASVEPELPDLHDVFHLTPSESAIVHDLYLGLSPHEIAENNDNSIHTIRAHIRRCYDKLGVTSREQLWRKLNAYRLA